MSDPVPRLRLALAMAAVAAVALLAAAGGVPGRATYGARVSADEPYYVLSALSLAADGDLDIAEELASERWRAFHEAKLPQQTKRLADGRRVAPHDPLLPVLLAPGVWWGAKLWRDDVVLAKLTLALLAAALAALLVWTAVRRLGAPLAAAAVTAGVFAASAPLAAYGHQLYPELPLALCVAVAVTALTGPLRIGGVTALLLAVVAMPWLAIKSVPVAATLALLGLAQLWRRDDRRMAAALVTLFAVGATAFLGVYRELYGGWTPYAAGDHFTQGEFTVVGTRVNLLGRAQRLVGLLVDRGFGIASWQPAWLLAIPAAAALATRRPARWLVLALPLAVGYLNATFVAYTMQGWWFPGRQLVAVLPCAVLATAWWLGRLRPRAVWLMAVLGGLGVWSYAWLVAEAWDRRLVWIVDFFTTPDPWYRAWSQIMPNYLRVTDSTWVLHAEWIVVFLALAWAGQRSMGRLPRPGFLSRRPRRARLAIRPPAFLESDREDNAT